MTDLGLKQVYVDVRCMFTGVSPTLADVQSLRLHKLTSMFTETSCHLSITAVYKPSQCLLVTCCYDYKVVTD